jgi:acetyl-CoA synthetase
VYEWAADRSAFWAEQSERTPELRKTRSGIMRRWLRGVAEPREVGDVTTLADSSVTNLIESNFSSVSTDDG